jgi:hypothetical protein
MMPVAGSSGWCATPTALQQPGLKRVSSMMRSGGWKRRGRARSYHPLRAIRLTGWSLMPTTRPSVRFRPSPIQSATRRTMIMIAPVGLTLRLIPRAAPSVTPTRPTAVCTAFMRPSAHLKRLRPLSSAIRLWGIAGVSVRPEVSASTLRWLRTTRITTRRMTMMRSIVLSRRSIHAPHHCHRIRSSPSSTMRTETLNITPRGAAM